MVNRNSVCGLILVFTLFLAFQNARAQKVKDLGGGCFLIKQKCKPTIKQTKWGFELGGLKFGAGKGIGRVQLGSELIQRLTGVAQILDLMQVMRCRDLNAFTTCDPNRQKILVIHSLATHQLGQLALLAQMHSGNPDTLREALLAWIVRSADLVDKFYSELFLAGGGQATSDLKIVLDAEDYALKHLKISPESPEFRKLLEDPIRAALPQ